MSAPYTMRERDALRARVAELERECADLSRTLEYRDDSRKHLRARAETAERDLEAARGLIARLGDADALESLNTLLARERARVAELERERDAVTACLAGREKHLGERIQTLIESGDLSARAVDFYADRADFHADRADFHADRAAEMERDLAEARLRVCTTAIGCGECERCRAVADATRLRRALVRIAPGRHTSEEFPDRPAHWEVKLECVRCRAFGADIDHLDARHKEDCPTRIARAALNAAPNAEPEGPDYSGLCSAPECGGHCGYVHAVGCEAIREYLAEHGGAPYKAPARTAHLAPSAEPTPRDMRVAEAVREQIARHIRMSPRFEGQLTTPNDNGLLGRVAQEIENLDLAAVVAKVVGT